MQQLANQRWFSLVELFLVFGYGAAVTIWPQLAGWLIISLLVPLIIRLVAGRNSFRWTSLYFPLALIIITAGIGVWAAYDQPAAWVKFWVIIGSTAIFVILINQSRANLGVVVSLVGLLGVIIAIIFLANNDWTIQSNDFGVIARAGKWISDQQLTFGKLTVRPNFIGGLLAIIIPITTGYIVYSLINGDKTKSIVSIAIWIILSASLFLTSSRGAWIALGIGAGAWLLWRASIYFSKRINKSPQIIVAILCVLIVIPMIWVVAIFPGGILGLSELLPGLPSGESRADLAFNTTRLIGDFSFTGGGLQSFPGLYSQYIMVTPFFLFSYSHNFYLDVILEQGFVGGLAILSVISLGTLLVIKSYKIEHPDSLSKWIAEAAVVSTLVVLIHGLVDDPLYGETGTPLLLLLPGIALMIARNDLDSAIPERPAAGVVENSPSGKTKNHGLVISGILLVLVAALAIGFWKPLAASWAANLGAVEMARHELQDWPLNEWKLDPNVSSLTDAERLFEQSLTFSQSQRTAWHRLGLISMQRRDFETAQSELATAFMIDPAYRGIRKSLGYAYVWGNQLEKAEHTLEGIAEAKSEMKVYTWWWKENDRQDLAIQANDFVGILDAE